MNQKNSSMSPGYKCQGTKSI